ncbi:MAG: hypothetical protein JO006_04060 [Paucibacter sp.]|nr:hypothetical protein [Roseateles sp.]
MKTLFRLFMGLGVGLAFLMIIGFTIALMSGHAHGLFSPDFDISINGESLDVGDLMGGFIGLTVAATVVLVLCVVLPLVLLLAIGLPLLIVGAVLAALVAVLCGVGAALGSPLILFVLLVIWMIKPRKKAVASAA